MARPERDVHHWDGAFHILPLLAHRPFRSHRTGNVIKSDFTRFVFPPRWHYDILRALDYFRAVDAPRDPRLSETIDIVRSRRRKDGRWPLEHSYRGKTYFALGRVGTPSRWNTLRGCRWMIDLPRTFVTGLVFKEE